MWEDGPPVAVDGITHVYCNTRRDTDERIVGML